MANRRDISGARRTVSSCAAVLLVLAACGTTGVVKLEPGRYMVSVKNAKIGFVSAAEEKANAYKQANQFCAEQRKEVETISLETTPSGLARQASATLEFRCVNNREKRGAISV